MDSFIQSHEATLRLGAFLSIFAAMALWELRAPRRVLAVSKVRRWSANLGLVVLNTLLLRLLFPVAAVGLAATAATQGWGLFNQLALPTGVEIVLAVIALDLAIWAQHVFFHAVPTLLLAVGIALVLSFRGGVDAQTLEQWIDAAGLAGPLIFIGIYVIATLLFLPGSPLTLAGGALFGPVWGTLINLAGATLGAALAYTWLGYAGREAAAGGAGLIRKGLIALALLAALAFLPRLVVRLGKTHSNPHRQPDD